MSLSRLLARSLAAVILTGLALMFVMRGSHPVFPTDAEPAALPIASPKVSAPAPASFTTSDHPILTPPAPPDEVPPPPPSFALDAAPLAWEQELKDTSARQRDAAARARSLFALLPRMPEEALATTATQAIELLPDADYASVALPIVTNPKTHGQVMSVLFADLMERPDVIVLPVLLSIARDRTHPFSSSALDNLQFLLGANFGSDWAKWNEAIQRALARKKQ